MDKDNATYAKTKDYDINAIPVIQDSTNCLDISCAMIMTLNISMVLNPLGPPLIYVKSKKKIKIGAAKITKSNESN